MLLMIRVLIESPYKGKDYEKIKTHKIYSIRCMQNSFLRGEAPFASHVLYAQTKVLNDKIPEERRQGIEAGFLWGSCAEITAVYTDYGITDGMNKGIKRAKKEGRRVEYRSIGKNKELS